MKPSGDAEVVGPPAAGIRAADRTAGDAPIAGFPAPRTAPDDDAEPAGAGQSLDEPPAVAATAPSGEAPASLALTDRERAILAFERQWWKYAGAKEQAIRETFGLSATRYYQMLNGLLDNPVALAAEPMLVGRLRRLRSNRSRARRR